VEIGRMKDEMGKMKKKRMFSPIIGKDFITSQDKEKT